MERRGEVKSRIFEARRQFECATQKRLGIPQDAERCCDLGKHAQCRDIVGTLADDFT